MVSLTVISVLAGVFLNVNVAKGIGFSPFDLNLSVAPGSSLTLPAHEIEVTNPSESPITVWMTVEGNLSTITNLDPWIFDLPAGPGLMNEGERPSAYVSATFTVPMDSAGNVYTGWIVATSGGASIGGHVTVSVLNPSNVLTVTSAHDSPTPTSGTFPTGTSITESVASPVAGPAGVQYVCTGWTGTGDVPASGNETSLTFTITQDSSIAWNWKTQYQFTVASAHDSPTPMAVGSYWIDANTLVSESVTTPADPVGLMRYRCAGYTGTGDLASGGTGNSVSFTIDQPTSVTFTWVAQYYLTVKTDPPGAAAIGGEGWYDASAAPTLTAPLVSGKYNFKYWFVDGAYQGTANVITVSMSAPHTAIAYYAPTVGGEWAPIDAVQLVTPWIAFMFLAMAFAAAGSHRLLKKRW